MTDDQRKDLADAWVLDQGGAADLKRYRDRRDKVLNDPANTELVGYKDYQKSAREYGGGDVYTYAPRTRVPEYQSGGIREMRNYLENGTGAGPTNPNFARAIQEERKKLEDKGVTGEELEERLDMWANSPEGYNAYRGTKSNINDPNAIAVQDTSNIPVPIAPPVVEGSTGGSTSGSTSDKPEEYTGYTGGWDAANNRPMYQTELIDDLDTYNAEMVEAYLVYKDAEYQKKKAERDATKEAA
jgi:hypothetical protein